MPRLITSKPRPHGRQEAYGAPSSPFQMAIFTEMKVRGISYADMAEDLGINKGTFWAWIHTSNGYPTPRSIKEPHFGIMADALGIPVPRLKELLDESRRRYTSKDVIPNPSSTDGLGQLITILGSDKRKYVKISYILNIAKMIHKGVSVNDARPLST